uniref:Uncharacterized protein n=1 Tax=Marseillevirus LCMAC101 TaxID=2506602 RepID=A0A481YSB2_9VIRU|nr:MAG: hypothetical protein LCMAC101_05340 [Marseillevirus LCMAC101]
MNKSRVYAINGPIDISSRDFIRLYGPKLESILEDPDASILLTDLPGVGIYTARYLLSQHYRNATVYHVGKKPRQNIANLNLRGGFKTPAEAKARMILDSGELYVREIVSDV